MDRELTITPILINHRPLPQPTSWVKIFLYEPTDPAVRETRGKMYALLAVSTTTRMDFSPIMEMIIAQIQESYFQQKTGGVLQTLETTLDLIQKRLILMAQGDKRLRTGFTFSLLLTVSWGQVLYLGKLGTSRAALLRDGTLQFIDAARSTSSLYLASGLLQANDRVLLGTAELFTATEGKRLKTLLDAPAATVARTVEGALGTGDERAMRSGILLDIDMRDVPSFDDEALHITDPDTATLTAPGRRRPDLFRRLTSRGWKNGLAAIVTTFARARGQKRTPILLITLAVLALAGSLVWNAVAGPQADAKAVDAAVTDLTATITQADGLVTINPDRALAVLVPVPVALAEARAIRSDPRLDALADRAELLRRQALGVVELSTGTPLGSVQQASTVSPKLILAGPNIFSVDTGRGHLVDLSSEPAVPVSTAPGLWTADTLLTGNDTGLWSARGNDVRRLNLDGSLGDTARFTANAAPVALTAFGSNAYALDAAAGNLIRLTRTGGIAQSAYFRDPLNPAGLLDAAVDGAVYLLRQGGTVERYRDGARQPLTLQRAALAQDARAIWAQEGQSCLYLLTADALLRWTKEGTYLGQFRLPDNAAWQGFAVDEAGQTLYSLSGNTLRRYPLPAD